MTPFANFWTLPGAGGNWQTIDTRWWSPTVTVNYAGNPAIERVVTGTWQATASRSAG